MRPDRAIVIGHRVVPRFGIRNGAHTPAGKIRILTQRSDDGLTMLAGRDVGVQAMPRVRGAYPARPLVAVERKCIDANVLTPETALKTLAQRARRVSLSASDCRLAQRF